MPKRIGLMLVLMVLAGGSQAAEQSKHIYGYKLMSPLERAEYKAEMRSLDTEEERQEFLQEHHEEMQERAAEEGISLPGP